MNWRGALALLAAAELCGCASLPVGSDGLGLDQRRALLDSVGAWEMHGRLTVDTGEGGFQGSFNWRQQDDALELAVRVRSATACCKWRGGRRADANGARRDTDIDGSRDRPLGAARLVATRHELAGLAARFSRPRLSRRHGPRHRWHARILEQRLWRVAYTAYHSRDSGDGQEVLVPRRIDLTHGNLALKLTIDDWQPTTPLARLEWSTTRPAQYRLGA